MRARAQIETLAGVHEATKQSRSRKIARDGGNGNAIAGQDAATLRDQARHLERDLDLARGVLNTLVQNIVGTGIDVEPAPRLPGQPINEELAQQLDHLFVDWWERPEVTFRHDAGGMQRLLARSWLRDGEALFQHVQGYSASLDHGSVVPYSVEMIEADMLPLTMRDAARNIVQGIELNAWGRPLAYHVYKSHPSDAYAYGRPETKRLPADRVEHIALVDRIGQLRGLSILASAMNRLEDIKDYEDSERIAAKVAASLTAFIKKGQPGEYADGSGAASGLLTPGGNRQYRDMRMVPGLIMDDLLPGEDIGLIDSKRPNPNAATFREGQLRAVSRGVSTTFSSLAGNYNGTYSAQRQELIEQWAAYAVLGEWFIAQAVRPMWRKFVESAYMAGLIKLPRGWTDLRYLSAATFVRPAMPWINPLHEVQALEVQEDRVWLPTSEIIRRRGGDPRDVLQQQAAWLRQREAAGLPASPATPLRVDTETEGTA
ncbi:phage portal protein [Lysobacter olei]